MSEEIMVESAQQISDDWRIVDWPQVERNVFRLQQRIYRASQRGIRPWRGERGRRGAV